MDNVVLDMPRILAAILPFLIPLVLLHIGLLIWALIDILNRDSYRVGNRIVWILICVFINTIGPILYFIVGRGIKREQHGIKYK